MLLISAFLLFLSQVQVEFQVQEEVEGCRRAVLRVLYYGFSDYCGRPNLFLSEGRTSCRLPLVLYKLFRNIPLFFNSHELKPLSYVNSQSQLTGQHQLLLFKYILFGSLYCRLLLQRMA